MNTQENNKLIAEFMGLESDRYYYTNADGSEDYVDYQNDEMHFDTSWDWLMPVVEKIEQVHEGVPQELINLSLFSTIDEVYNAVIEFIKQYNK